MVGPIAGGQVSWVSYDDQDVKDLYRVDSRPGFHAGVNLSFAVRKRFYLHTAFMYSTKGKTVDGNVDPMLHQEVRYRYIDVPVVYTVDFKARLGKLKEFKYFVGLGPNISYWLGGKGTLYTSDYHEANMAEPVAYKISFSEPVDGSDEALMTVADPNRIQLGLNLAAGAVFEPFGYQRVMVMLRYEFGHSYFSRTSNGIFANTYYQDVLQSRNQGFRLSVAYLINLKVEERKKGKSTMNKKRRL